MTTGAAFKAGAILRVLDHDGLELPPEDIARNVGDPKRAVGSMLDLLAAFQFVRKVGTRYYRITELGRHLLAVYDDERDERCEFMFAFRSLGAQLAD